jgi:hypothetical protein
VYETPEDEGKLGSTTEAGESLAFAVGLGSSSSGDEDSGDGGETRLTCQACDPPDCLVNYECQNALWVSQTD